MGYLEIFWVEMKYGDKQGLFIDQDFLVIVYQQGVNLIQCVMIGLKNYEIEQYRKDSIRVCCMQKGYYGCVIFVLGVCVYYIVT